MGREARWLFLCLLASACSNGATLVVDVRTDLRPDFEFGSVELLVTRADGSLARRTVVPAMRADDFLSGQRVGEIVDLARGAYALDTRLLDHAGAVVTARHTSLDVHDDLAVVVVITRDCRGLVCPATGAPDATECLGGRCVTPACAAGDVTACPPPLCTASPECPTTVACAPPRCLLGVCLAQPDDTRCPPGDWCDPSTGCVAIPDADAGAPSHDAGPTSDAGCVAGAACDTGRACELGAIACTGGVRSCVATGPRAAGHVCRAASGDCDVAERCDGSSTACPPDEVATSGVCRASAGPCDMVESCDGSSADCPPDRYYGRSRGCRAGGGPCDPGESCDGSGPDCPPDDVAPDGTGCGATWSELGCGPVDVSTCQGGACMHDGSFTGNQPSCGAIGSFCGFSPSCCGSGGMFCISGGDIYGSSYDCSQCCAVGNCCMDGNPAGPCI